MGDQVEVLLDGGVRRGGDVVKALALGARAVMIGRAYLWGLAAGGQAGVENVLDILRSGIDSALLGLGRSSVRELTCGRHRDPARLHPGPRRRRAGRAASVTGMAEMAGLAGLAGATVLGDLTWPQAQRLAAAGAMLAVPVGSTEQHGPHLPLSTDTDVAVALAARLAARRAGVVLAPPVGYGSSGEHAGFAGTISIGQQALELTLLELGRSAAETFGHILFLCAHGGNREPAARAVARLRAELGGRAALDGVSHASRICRVRQAAGADQGGA